MRLASLIGTLLLVGAVPLALRANSHLSTYRQQKHWPKAQGTILESGVVEHRDDNGSSYTAKLVCLYSVNGQAYRSSQHTDGYKYPVTQAGAEEVSRQFPVGSAVEVSVNPGNASEAILDTGFPRVWEVTWRASLAGIAAGLAIVLYQAW